MHAERTNEHAENPYCTQSQECSILHSHVLLLRGGCQLGRLLRVRYVVVQQRDEHGCAVALLLQPTIHHLQRSETTNELAWLHAEASSSYSNAAPYPHGFRFGLGPSPIFVVLGEGDLQWLSSTRHPLPLSKLGT